MATGFPTMKIVVTDEKMIRTGTNGVSSGGVVTKHEASLDVLIKITVERVVMWLNPKTCEVDVDDVTTVVVVVVTVVTGLIQVSIGVSELAAGNRDETNAKKPTSSSVYFTQPNPYIRPDPQGYSSHIRPLVCCRDA
jgi:hypothetical protein